MKNFKAVCVVALIAALAGARCGSSSTTSTAPSTVSRCSVALGAADLNVSAAGGPGTVAITTARECAWTANSTVSWLTLRTTNGQGDGTVDFVAAANPDSSVRRGIIELNDQKANINQAAADCSIQLSDSSETFPASGGSATFDVKASGPGCSWTSATDASWIVIRSGVSGTGNGSVTIDVAAGTGSPRSATVVVGGQSFSVTQQTASQSCTFSIDPTNYAAGPAGGSTSIAVTTAAGCPWTAASNVPWATVTQGATGTGPGAAQITVDASAGGDRSGTVLVAGQLVTVTQVQGQQACSFNVTPQNQSFGAQGGTGSASVSAPAGCGWTASSAVAWISVTPTTGSGGGGISFTVAALIGAARSGAVNVAGTTFTVTQSSGCGFSIAPSSATVPSAGGNGTVTVTTASDCAWTASSNASWLTIGSGASGTGNGTVQFTAAATTSVSRSGTLTIAGQTFTVTQGSGCTFSIGSTSASAAAAGSSGSVAVTSGSGCPWTAAPSVSWLTVTSGASSSGNGTVQYTAAANTGPARSGGLTIAGHAFTVNQASGCGFAINPSVGTIPGAGGTGNILVTAGAQCTWTAVSGVSWMTVTAGASGNGNGTVTFTSPANTGSPRSGTIIIAGQTFTGNQTTGCTFQVSSNSVDFKKAGSSTETVRVTTNLDACAWTASSNNVSWISVRPTSGNGDGTVEIVVTANIGLDRKATITVAGQQVTVSQDGLLNDTVERPH